MTEAAYFEMIGANLVFGLVTGLIVLTLLWAKGKSFDGFYGLFLVLALSPFSFVLALPVAVMYCIKILKEK